MVYPELLWWNRQWFESIFHIDSGLYLLFTQRLADFFRVDLQLVRLPYDKTNPIIYDKDEVVNCYTDDYIMALASAGDIHLVGMITSSTVQPYNTYVKPEDYDRILVQRAESVQHARNSGFSNIPDPVCGPKGHLERPASGKIAGTQPLGSPGSWLIVTEARQAIPEKPLVVVMGGALTVVADAYLLDTSIADNVVVAWIGGSTDGMQDYNGWADGWAAYIVLQKLRLVQFPSWRTVPYVPKSRLTELPDTPLRQWMIDKQHRHWTTPDGQLQPGSYDGDTPPAISVMRRDYALRAKHVAFSHWTVIDGHEVPAFKTARNSRVLIVTRASTEVATAEWWRALKNPAAYHK